ncbi:unnamed protein product [Mytilus coruscus]|uniref:Uncharacterized protein n=1 Tax=Mytilus coruscus TaxID=42192 RepID=A0A6J8D3S0_MYTCO|nr:unnamed protein product [Mytilus coruscus]
MMISTICTVRGQIVAFIKSSFILIVAGETLPSTITANTTTTKTTPTSSIPGNSTISDSDTLITKIPNGEVTAGLIAGVAVGGQAIFVVLSFAMARVFGLGKSAQIWTSGLKPDGSMINVNVNAENFYCLDYKGEYVSTTSAKTHAFTNVI